MLKMQAICNVSVDQDTQTEASSSDKYLIYIGIILWGYVIYLFN